MYPDFAIAADCFITNHNLFIDSLFHVTLSEKSINHRWLDMMHVSNHCADANESNYYKYHPIICWNLSMYSSGCPNLVHSR